MKTIIQIPEGGIILFFKKGTSIEILGENIRYTFSVFGDYENSRNYHFQKDSLVFFDLFPFKYSINPYLDSDNQVIQVTTEDKEECSENNTVGWYSYEEVGISVELPTYLL